MKCPKCGTRIPLLSDSEVVCSGCSTNLKSDSVGCLFILAIILYLPVKIYLVMLRTNDFAAYILALAIVLIIYFSACQVFVNYKEVNNDENI